MIVGIEIYKRPYIDDIFIGYAKSFSFGAKRLLAYAELKGSSFFIFISFFPAFQHSFVEFCFGRSVGLCMPETGVGGFIGQELLLYEMVGEIVCVFIAIVVAEFCHPFGWCVSDVERNREIPRLLHVLECCIDGEIGRIAFRTGS